MIRLRPALRGALTEMLVRAAAAAWVLGFSAAIEGALLKLYYWRQAPWRRRPRGTSVPPSVAEPAWPRGVSRRPARSCAPPRGSAMRPAGALAAPPRRAHRIVFSWSTTVSSRAARCGWRVARA